MQIKEIEMTLIDDPLKSGGIITSPGKKYQTCNREFQGIPGIGSTNAGSGLRPLAGRNGSLFDLYLS